ncbi:MAG: Hsp70 family protein [Patescibacteria group bacterium]
MKKQKFFYGIDFGTTNSTIAVSDSSGKVKTLPVDPQAENPSVVRSTIYINQNKEFHFGKSAIDIYAHDVATGSATSKYLIFTGRYIKVPKISFIAGYSGEQLVPEIVEAEKRGYGHLFQSLKLGLSRSYLTPFEIFGEKLSLEKLIGSFLKEMKSRAEQLMNEEIEEVVIGKPIHFVGNNDDLAVKRLTNAAKEAGFEKIVFEYEPIGAAWDYGLHQMKTKQTILIFDFGGGTLDISIVSFPSREILANEGLAVGGDLFNSLIFEKKIAKYFGSQATYGLAKLRLPHFIFDYLKGWYTISLLKTKDFEKPLNEFAFLSSNPKAIAALRSLISNNLGFSLYEEIERVKKNLSQTNQETFSFQNKNIDTKTQITRKEFERIISQQISEVEATLNHALASAKKKTEEIDVVATTGGSSLIPVFQNLLKKKFGSKKLKRQETFTSVATGLALRAKEIFSP